ncbi:MAG TPA: hypothetical protein VL974_09635 [Magnetospirillum sp.]|jgi:type II secretory pathway pseudopilin PulG|nr:hypothetical protein [Magnetospirillum sp.]
MTTKVVGVLAAIVAAGLPVASAWAQVEHAQRLALEVAIRRAQVRAQSCPQQQVLPSPVQPGAPGTAPNLPASPPVGTAGPVDCTAPLMWPFGH